MSYAWKTLAERPAINVVDVGENAWDAEWNPSSSRRLPSLALRLYPGLLLRLSLLKLPL